MLGIRASAWRFLLAATAVASMLLFAATANSTVLPTTPTGVTATPGNGVAVVDWNPSTDPGGPGINGYEVYVNGVDIYGGGCNKPGVLPCSMTANLTNGVRYAITVAAQDLNGNLSPQSAPVYVTPGTTGGGPSVPATPLGPPTPSGGWRVEYGDAFGACFMQTGPGCSSGYAHSDGSLVAQTNAGGNGNSNEIDAFEPGSVDVSTRGLVFTCTQTANLGDSYTCGQILGNGGVAGTNGHAPAAPAPFHWSPPAGTFALQYEAQLPANQGNMDPGIWSNGPSDNPELDSAEYWGMHQPPQSGACGTWTGDGWGFPAVPFDSGGSTGGPSSYWCGAGGPTFDPSAAMHVYTMYITTSGSTTTMTGYVDGVKVTGPRTYSNFNKAAEKLILGMSMRRDTKTGLNYSLPSGGVQLVIPYVAVYEAASANNAGTNGPMIISGTSVQ